MSRHACRTELPTLNFVYMWFHIWSYPVLGWKTYLFMLKGNRQCAVVLVAFCKPLSCFSSHYRWPIHLVVTLQCLFFFLPNGWLSHCLVFHSVIGSTARWFYAVRSIWTKCHLGLIVFWTEQLQEMVLHWWETQWHKNQS